MSDLQEEAEESSSQQLSRGNFRRLVGFVLRERGLLGAGTVFILIANGAALLEPWLFGYAIDHAIVPREWEMLRLLAFAYLAAECIRAAATIAHAHFFSLLGQRVMQSLRMAVFTHLQRLPINTYDRNPAGKLVTRVTNDVSALAEMFSAGFVTIIGNVLVIVGIVIWLLALNWKLGLISVSVFPVMLAVTFYFSGKLRVSYRAARSKLSALNAFLAENILGMRVVQLFNRQGIHLERFARVNDWYAQAQIRTVSLFALFQPSITWASGLSMALVLFFGGRMALAGEIQVGVLASYFFYVALLFQPMREIADKWNIFLSGMASAERIFSILDWPTEIAEANAVAPARPLADVRGHIRFENVWFAYSGEEWVLKGFNAEFAPGVRIGIVGHTGAGKTTLISLLLRFYDPQRGRILLDGRDLRDYDQRELRASIGLIQQDVFLFSGTVAENVSLWRGDLPTAATDQIRSFGIDETRLLDERGSNLSVGQRQILAFNRARAAQPSLWILDEATSNIDSESERVLQEVLASSTQGKTAILIAHRLATVRSAHRILVLNHGELVESGSHAELIERGGIYARLYRYQDAVEQAESGEGNQAGEQTGRQ